MQLSFLEAARNDMKQKAKRLGKAEANLWVFNITIDPSPSGTYGRSIFDQSMSLELDRLIC
jgi:hypothetical protein